MFPFMETTTEKEREIIVLVSFSIIMFVVCIVSANWLLPKHCSLFDDNIPHPQMCHTPGMKCDLCEDIATASVASTIAGLGISFFFLPFAVFAIRNLRNRPIEQTKLFD